jgi:hypothetical protein
MRFMCLYKPGFESDAPPTQGEIESMGALIGEMASAGVLLATDGLLPSSRESVRIRLDGAKFSFTDGPFAETKELIAGFAILQASSKDEVVGWCKRFLEVAGGGESEIRLMYDEPAFPPSDRQPAQAVTS